VCIFICISCTGQKNTMDVDISLRSGLGNHHRAHVQQLGQLHNPHLHPDVHERSPQVRRQTGAWRFCVAALCVVVKRHLKIYTSATLCWHGICCCGLFMSVCLSARLSVTSRCCTEIAKRRKTSRSCELF